VGPSGDRTGIAFVFPYLFPRPHESILGREVVRGHEVSRWHAKLNTRVLPSGPGDMGLTVGATYFVKNNIPLLSDAAVVYSHEAPVGSRDLLVPGSVEVAIRKGDAVAIILDAMTTVFALTPSHPVYPPRMERVTSVNRTGQETCKDTSTFAPVDLYETFACKMLTMVQSYRQTQDVTLAILFDKASLVVDQKSHVQRKRSNAAVSRPYRIPGLSMEELTSYQADNVKLHNVHFCDEGLMIFGSGDEVGGSQGGLATQGDSFHQETPGLLYVTSQRIMSTRCIRQRWYAYLTTKLLMDARFRGVNVLVDYQPGGPLQLTTGGAVCRPDLEVRCGEAELTAVGLAMILATTHHIQLWSGDTDILILGLLHAHRLGPTCVVTLLGIKGTCRTMHPGRFSETLRQRCWGTASFCIGLMLNGTDYINKSSLLYYISATTVMHGTRSSIRFTRDHLKDMNHVSTVCADPILFKRLVVAILSGHYQQTSIGPGKGASPPVWTARPGHAPDVPFHLTTRDLVTRRRVVRGKTVGLPSDDDLESARKWVSFNWEYWCGLQGFITTYKHSMMAMKLSVQLQCSPMYLPREHSH
jgi:hypothetical protein